MALSPRKPQPEDFPGGKDDPEYSRALKHYEKLREDKRKFPERWGGMPVDIAEKYKSDPAPKAISQAPQQPTVQ